MTDSLSESASLPPGFETLVPFLSLWSVEGTAARAQRRFESSHQEREDFYAAGLPYQRSALKLLDQKPLGTHDERERRLLNLMLSFAHVALAIEVQGPEEDRHRQSSRHMVITRSVADR